MGLSGTKRKGAPSSASLAACVTRPFKCSSGAAAAAAMEVRSDWASLLPDLTQLIAARVLAADVVDYMSLRAVCARWRASTPSPRDPSLRDARLRPRGWVPLCDGDGVRPADACEVAFLSTATGRRVHVRLPELRGHRIVGFTDGLLILVNKGTTAVRVLHPFTRVAVDLPPIGPIFDHMVKDQLSRAWMRAAVCISQNSPDSIAVVVWFPNAAGVVVAEPGSPCWYIVHHTLQLASAVPFQGRLYGVIRSKMAVLQIYPQCLDPCIAGIPRFDIPQTNSFFLLESAARLVLVLRHFSYHNPTNPTTKGYGPNQFALFEVGTAEQRGLAPLSSLGDQALFLGLDRCLSVSGNNLPSISGDAIYFYSEDLYPLLMHSVSSSTCEKLSKLSIIHDGNKRIRPSVRPFTLADHLFTFCSHRCWSRGLMFHEYHYIPTSWKDLFKKYKAQDSEVQFPSSRGLSCKK